MRESQPKNFALKQQRLPSWRPIMTAGSVLPVFIAVGVIFVPLGITFVMTSGSIQELVVDYTQSCRSAKSSFPCYLEIASSPGSVCQCMIHVNITEEFLGQVFIYYGLERFYQNHRRYLKAGENVWHHSESDNHFISSESSSSKSSNRRPTFGGIFESSLFNDSFSVSLVNGTMLIPVPFTNEGIAWEADVRKWKNYGFNSTVDIEELLVWMRSAAMPKFRKFRGRLNRSGLFSAGLPAGPYIISINYTYPVVGHGGKKQVILTTTSWLGGKNRFLGVAYICTGMVSALFGISFIIFHTRSGMHPMTFLEDLHVHST